MVGGEIDAPGGRITVYVRDEDGELRATIRNPKQAVHVVDAEKSEYKARAVNK